MTYKYSLMWRGWLLDEGHDVSRLWQIAVDLYRLGVIGVELCIIDDSDHRAWMNEQRRLMPELLR